MHHFRVPGPKVTIVRPGLTHMQRAVLALHAAVDRVDGVPAALIGGRYAWRPLAGQIRYRPITPVGRWLHSVLPKQPDIAKMERQALLARFRAMQEARQ